MIREANKKDNKILSDWLKSENLEDEQMGFEKHETYIMEKDSEPVGFYTFRNECGYPYLVHFYLAKACRGYKMALRLINSFVSTVGNKFIVNVPEDNEHLNALVSKYFCVKHYAINEKHKFYLVEA